MDLELCSQWVETTHLTSVFSLRTSVFTSPHGTTLMAYGCLYTDVRWVGFLPPLCSQHFPNGLCQSEGVGKDHTVCLGGARPLRNYKLSNHMSSTKLKIFDKLRPNKQL